MQPEKAERFILEKLKKELPGYLHYHSVEHTSDVLNAALRIAKEEGVYGDELVLLKTAALYHDAGFTVQANDHEKIGCDIARKALPRFNYTPEQIDYICGMIMATKIPQAPNNLLEQIICDADLDYLGRDDYWVISNKLYKEIKKNGEQLTVAEWCEFQIQFLEQHHYFTDSVIKLRTQKKQEYLQSIKKSLLSLSNT